MIFMFELQAHPSDQLKEFTRRLSEILFNAGWSTPPNKGGCHPGGGQPEVDLKGSLCWVFISALGLPIVRATLPEVDRPSLCEAINKLNEQMREHWSCLGLGCTPWHDESRRVRNPTKGDTLKNNGTFDGTFRKRSGRS